MARPSTSASRPLRITLLSNGHGEDVVGARLLRAFTERATDVTLQAYPTVDRGDAYESLGVPILGPRRVMPSGGLLFHHPALFWRDVRAGFVGMTGRQLRDLRRLDTDILVVVGDVSSRCALRVRFAARRRRICRLLAVGLSRTAAARRTSPHARSTARAAHEQGGGAASTSSSATAPTTSTSATQRPNSCCAVRDSVRSATSATRCSTLCLTIGLTTGPRTAPKT
ncbi:MAG: hypothetical protein U5L04_09910 [Trueperaceae bacterium]|nr:hypothetical protein [Trueperaceae bacterium]